MQRAFSGVSVTAPSGLVRTALLVMTLSLVGMLSAAAADKPMPTDEELRKIASAVPTKASAAPKQPRKLLVFTLCKGYYHTSIPYGAKAVALSGERTGAFKATLSDDAAFFEPERLREFDGVCLVSALGEFFLPDNLDTLPSAEQLAARERDARLKKNLEDYIRSGKGLAGIHGGCWAFNQTPAFAEMLGATFVNHPWNSTERIAVKIDEPSHPVVAAFRGAGFEIIDEGYQFKAPYSRAKLRVLLSLDTARMDMNKPNLRADGDFALCWVKRFGQGRIFYTALGHNAEEFWNPQLLRHILDGIQFALGDLPAESEPRP
jgi:type 1 glutamine amidotransferase